MDDDGIREALLMSLLRGCAADGTARQLRERHHLSGAEVARVLGVHKATLSKWERGLQTPRGAAARRYAQLLAALQESE